MTRSSSPRNRLIGMGSFLIFFLIAGFHFSTLEAPPVSMDDATIYDGVLHGTLKLWQEILPADHQELIHTYGLGFLGSYVGLTRALLAHSPVSLFRSRLPACVSSLIALAILFWLLRDISPPWLAWLALLGTGLSSTYFRMAHTLRGEAQIFLIMCLNLAWCWKGGGVWLGVLLGGVTGWAIAYHPTIIFLALVFPLFISWHEEWHLPKSPRRYIAWLIGCAAGVVSTLWLVNVDDMMRYLMFHAGHAVTLPLALRWKNLPSGIFEMLTPIYQVENVWFPLFLGVLFSTLALQLRRFRSLARVEQAICLLALSFPLAYCLLSATLNIHYFSYFMPWLYLAQALAIAHLLKGRWELDATDAALILATSLAFWLAPGRDTPGTWLLPVWLVGCIGVLVHLSSARRAVFLGVLLVLFISFPENLLSTAVGAAHMARYQPLLFMGVFVIPSCVGGFLLVNYGQRGRGREVQWLACGALLIVALYVQKDVRIIYRSIEKATISPELRNRLALLHREKRVAAPVQLWVYEPEITMQATEPLTQLERRYSRTVALKALADYSPTYVLWPPDQADALVRFFNSERPQQPRASKEAVWELPFGTYTGIRLKK